MLRHIRRLLLVAACWAPGPAAAQAPGGAELLIRVDDMGMNHSVNMALEQLAATHLPLSA